MGNFDVIIVNPSRWNIPSTSCGQRLQNFPGSFQRLVIIAFESALENDKNLFAASLLIHKLRMSLFYHFTFLKLN